MEKAKEEKEEKKEKKKEKRKKKKENCCGQDGTGSKALSIRGSRGPEMFKVKSPLFFNLLLKTRRNS